MWDRPKRWQRAHPGPARIANGLLFAALFFLLSLIDEAPGPALRGSIIAAVIYTVGMCFFFDRRGGRLRSR